MSKAKQFKIRMLGFDRIMPPSTYEIFSKQRFKLIRKISGSIEHERNATFWNWERCIGGFNAWSIAFPLRDVS